MMLTSAARWPQSDVILPPEWQTYFFCLHLELLFYLSINIALYQMDSECSDKRSSLLHSNINNKQSFIMHVY
jgi:hypothetical protein